MEPDKLSSWKEIATFLKVDIKTAQRWEKQRGLPVKRIPGGRRGSVYAIPEDIEDWLRSADVEEPVQEPRLGQAAVPPAQSKVSNRKLWIAGLAGAAVVAVAVASVMRGGGAEIASAEVRGQTLTALDKRGNAIWSFELEPGDRPLQPEEGWRDALRTVRWNRGSRPEVVAAIYQEKVSGPETRILCFDTRGRIRWRWEVGFPLLDFNGQPFEKNWGLMQILPDDTGGESVVWAAVVNPFRWPSGLFRLDSVGRARLQFANAGSIMRVLRLPKSAGAKLLVAGVNNAWSRPFVAEVHADGHQRFPLPAGTIATIFQKTRRGCRSVIFCCRIRSSTGRATSAISTCETCSGWTTGSWWRWWT